MVPSSRSWSWVSHLACATAWTGTTSPRSPTSPALASGRPSRSTPTSQSPRSRRTATGTTAAGATTPQAGTLMLGSFVVGLLLSNSLVAAFASFGFVSTHTKQNVYLSLGVLAGAFSLVVGIMFLTGQADALPDLQDVLNSIFGAVGEG